MRDTLWDAAAGSVMLDCLDTATLECIVADLKAKAHGGGWRGKALMTEMYSKACRVLDGREDWTGKVLELPRCRDKGDTIKELHDNIKEAMEIWIEETLEAGDPIPEPEGETIRQFADSIPRELWLAPLPLEEEDWEENRHEAHSAHIPLSE